MTALETEHITITTERTPKIFLSTLREGEFDSSFVVDEMQRAQDSHDDAIRAEVESDETEENRELTGRIDKIFEEEAPRKRWWKR